MSWGQVSPSCVHAIVGVVSKGQEKGFQEYYALQYYNEGILEPIFSLNS